MSIAITLLQKIETISALKVLTYLYNKSNSKGVIRISVNHLIDGSGIARNSVKRGLYELVNKNIIEQIATGKGNHPNTYRVSKVDVPQEVKQELEGWSKATGARSQPTPSDASMTNEDANAIVYKDFSEYNFLYSDINSLSAENENFGLSDEQLGKLARRVLIEWYMPLAKFDSKQPPHFFPQQMKLIKKLLSEWRTDQVLASIEYWTQISPPKNGMKSLAWLNFEKKGVSHVMVALDYHKQAYIEKQGELEESIRKAKVDEMKAKALDIAKDNLVKKTKVDDMDDNDFIKNLLGGMGSIKSGGD